MNAARFARTMGGLLDSGTPVLPAINTAKNTLKNTVMRDAAETIVEQVRGGSSLGAALKGAAVFPPLMMHMIAGGEASGDLGEMFGVSADYLESEFESSTTIVLNLLEPMIIVFLGGVVLLIVAAIFMPILKLNTMAFLGVIMNIEIDEKKKNQAGFTLVEVMVTMVIIGLMIAGVTINVLPMISKGKITRAEN